MKGALFSVDSIKYSTTRWLAVVLATTVTIEAFDEVHGATISGLFNTGVNATGTVLRNDTADMHYSLTGPLSGAFVSPRYNGGSPASTWLVPPPGSAWICPNPQIAPDGDYSYTLKFDLAGFDTATASLSGQLAADNRAQIFFNGIDTGFYTSSFTAMSPFMITNGFLAGTNTLEFRVHNSRLSTGARNPTGLLIAELAGTVQALAPASVRCSEVEICWQSQSNRLYEVEYRSDLTTNTWVALFTNIVGSAGTTCVNDKIIIGTPQRFYRVVLPTE